jgi:cytochrome c
MKRICSLALVVSMLSWNLISCGSKTEKKEGDDDAYDAYETAEPKKQSSSELIAQGQALVNQSDCKTCHHLTNKLIGPAHQEVAKKYEFTRANISMLADKIINGGSGNWGEIPMTAHPDLSRGDAEKMAMYVLSLDGEQPPKN